MAMHEAQIEYWNDPSVAADVRAGTTGVSEFAQTVAESLRPVSRVLELGCGAGDDAAYFAQQGHDVVAMDVSRPLIELASQRYANVQNLVFRSADITQRLDVGGESTDFVYSRLGLHYFTDETTIGVMNEVFWVLRPSGHFAFMVLSADDPRYGRGKVIEEDMYEYKGEVRHFFTRQYVTELMAETGFVNVQVTSGHSKIYGEPSAFITAQGTKR